jgi:hypothetical protein
MLVSLQSRQIGFRNIHTIKPGGKKTVGGRRSAFLVFVVPFPRRIAEIQYRDGSHIFRVIKSQYFPTVVESEIPNCLGVNIPAVSAKGFPVVIRFVRYISALERINRRLHAAYHAGVSGADPDREALPTVDVGHRFL